MRLPEDVENTLKAHGAKAAIGRLCQQHRMSPGAANAWVQARCGELGLEKTGRLAGGKVMVLLVAACLAGMAVAALEKIL